MYSRLVDPGLAPPPFLPLAGHPLRWRLLVELAQSDRAVRELTARLDVPQNLVSYHLGQLRAANLVSARRSTADRRDTYYCLDLDHCGELLATAGATLHPGLRLTQPALPVPPKARILFLCTGNSSRSQMAESLVRELTGARVSAFSAGSHPKPVHPYAVRVMAEAGIDLSGARSKPLDRFVSRRFDYVVTLCDRVREVCPEFPGAGERVHWSVADPAADPEGYPAFQRTADELTSRVRFLLHRITAARPRRAR